MRFTSGSVAMPCIAQPSSNHRLSRTAAPTSAACIVRFTPNAHLSASLSSSAPPAPLALAPAPLSALASLASARHTTSRSSASARSPAAVQNNSRLYKASAACMRTACLILNVSLVSTSGINGMKSTARYLATSAVTPAGHLRLCPPARQRSALGACTRAAPARLRPRAGRRRAPPPRRLPAARCAASGWRPG